MRAKPIRAAVDKQSAAVGIYQGQVVTDSFLVFVERQAARRFAVAAVG
jgi:hypothetical protein